MLEVFLLGVDCLLFNLEQFGCYQGELVKVMLKLLQDNCCCLQGCIEVIDEVVGIVIFIVDKVEVVVLVDNIDKVWIMFDWVVLGLVLSKLIGLVLKCLKLNMNFFFNELVVKKLCVE